MTKVHIGFAAPETTERRAEKGKDEQATEAALEWARKMGLEHAKYRRGILTCDVDEDRLEELKQATEVDWLEVDEEKHMI